MVASSEPLFVDFEKQSEVLNASSDQVDVSGVLNSVGWSIDDLVYKNSKTRIWDHNKSSKPRSLSEFKKIGQDIPLVSFFTGCGGADLGFEAVGFQHKAAFEISEYCCQTLRFNRSYWSIFGPPKHAGDLSDTKTICDILSATITKPFDGVFIGGPPCQPFSIASAQRFSKSGRKFKRIGFQDQTNGNLLGDFINLIQEFRPSVFVIENVPGLKDLDSGAQLRSVLAHIGTLGYSVHEPYVINAADYGIPQYRKRLFILGSRVRGSLAMMPTRPRIGSGSVLFAQPGDQALNHDTRSHRIASIKRYMHLDYGERDHLGRVNRLDPTKPSNTVIAGGTAGGGRSHLHPEIPRTLSVRECARLQTFPDSYRFMGSMSRQFTQVGNAVPPVLAAEIATQLAKAYFS